MSKSKMHKMVPPLRYVPFSTGVGTAGNIGSIRDEENKAVCSYVNRYNAEKIIEALDHVEQS